MAKIAAHKYILNHAYFAETNCIQHVVIFERSHVFGVFNLSACKYRCGVITSEHRCIILEYM